MLLGNNTGTPGFKPPEMKGTRRYSASPIDIYALGVTLYIIDNQCYPKEKDLYALASTYNKLNKVRRESS